MARLRWHMEHGEGAGFIGVGLDPTSGGAGDDAEDVGVSPASVRALSPSLGLKAPGPWPSPPASVCERPQPSGCAGSSEAGELVVAAARSMRTRLGVLPNSSRMTRVKWAWSLKPRLTARVA